MKKHVRLDHKQSSTARPRPQQMCWRGNSRWVLVAALCIVTFLGMLGIASAAQHSGGPLTLAQKEQRIQQLLNAGRAHLRPKPTTPQVPSPQPAPTLHAGIINMQQGPVGSNWELVYAGAERNPDGSVKQGALKLYTKDLTPIGTYPAPSGAGALTIIAVKRNTRSSVLHVIGTKSFMTIFLGAPIPFYRKGGRMKCRTPIVLLLTEA